LPGLQLFGSLEEEQAELTLQYKIESWFSEFGNNLVLPSTL
jgi:hypothetical protein